jgi:hypothetical protein
MKRRCCTKSFFATEGTENAENCLGRLAEYKLLSVASGTSVAYATLANVITPKTLAGIVRRGWKYKMVL